jgi:hypothetical protein
LNHDAQYYETRNEARKKAIEKAVEIYNSQTARINWKEVE